MAAPRRPVRSAPAFRRLDELEAALRRIPLGATMSGREDLSVCVRYRSSTPKGSRSVDRCTTPRVMHGSRRSSTARSHSQALIRDGVRRLFTQP